MSITPEELTRLRELESKATPGEWKPDDDDDVMAPSSCGDGEIAVARHAVTCGADPQPLHDAEFIAAIRNAMPALLDEIERLRAFVEWRKELAVTAHAKGYAKYRDTEELERLKQLDIDIRSPEPFAELTPEAVAEYLRAKGWQKSDLPFGSLVGWKQDGHSVLMPPTTDYIYFAKAMQGVVVDLAKYEQRSQLAILLELKGMK